MTAPMTAERRREIADRARRDNAFAVNVGNTLCMSHMLLECLAEIDRLTAERDAAVAAAVMAEREACAAICDEFAQIELTVLFDGPAMSRQIALSIRSRPALAPAVESSAPADDDGDTLADGDDRDLEAWLGDR